LVSSNTPYDVEGAIAIVDFIKAFDSLEWTFILETLKQFRFYESFLIWDKT
jgi:hypothetical protein